jgi:hypothetical protein
MKNNASSFHGYDFYFRVTGPDGKSHINHVRLFGPSEDWLNSVRPQYAKEGFRLEPSSQDEYRSANWKRRNAA